MPTKTIVRASDLPRSLSLLAIALLGLVAASCAGTRIIGNDLRITHPVRRIGLSPSGGKMMDAIAVAFNESEDCQAEVLDTQATLALLKRLGIPSVQGSRPQNLAHMKSEGLDAYLRIATTRKLFSTVSKSIEVKLLSTHDPTKFIQFVWKNAWGGLPGSAADGMMSKGQATAAAEIAAELVRRLALAPLPKQ